MKESLPTDVAFRSLYLPASSSSAAAMAMATSGRSRKHLINFFHEAFRGKLSAMNSHVLLNTLCFCDALGNFNPPPSLQESFLNPILQAKGGKENQRIPPIKNPEIWVPKVVAKRLRIQI